MTDVPGTGADLMSDGLGFTSFGRGPVRVVVLHDWFCDRSSWDTVLPYLTPDRFSYLFADLRGYGASRDLQGSFTLDEAAGDVLALADQLGWTRFSLIGHSMSGLIVQRIAQLAPDRIARIVAITPVPPGGLGLDDPALEFHRSLALADDETRFSLLGALRGKRLSETWTRYKLRRWRETASPAALVKYAEMWGCTDISPGAFGMQTQMLIIAAGQDAPPFREDALRSSMLPFYPNAQLMSLDESGHYPMQEQPPLLATVIERFLAE
ncbi:MAG: alpha/beta hydrolase [Bryobacteraceae bacterium]|nr:alpha/beta hydrolase [Bryobacteraceae bacterium]